MMRKLIVLVLLVSAYTSLSAQFKVGTMNPDSARMQIEEYQLLVKRFDRLTQEKLNEVNWLKEMMAEIEQRLKAETKISSQEEQMKLMQKLKMLDNELIIKQSEVYEELNRREMELTQPFEQKFAASIEEIALEEGLNLVLHPDHITEEFKKYIGKEHFVDITDLVIQRVSEK